MADETATAILRSQGQALGLLINELDMPDSFKDALVELILELNDLELKQLTDHLVLAVLSQSAREETEEYQTGEEEIDQETVKQLRELLDGKPFNS